MFKKGMVVMAILSVSMAAISSGAHADGYPLRFNDRSSRDDRRDDVKIERLEREVDQLQNQVRDLDARLGRLERTPVSAGWTCSLLDNLGNSYFGRGTTKIEAEHNAKAACQKVYDAMFCKQAPRCEQ